MKDGFRYDSDKHHYWLNERRLPGVTEVLSVLPNGYEAVAPDVLEDKRLLGSAVHLACEYDDLGWLDESTVDPKVAPYLKAWRSFRADIGFICSIVEKRGYSREYGYGGTVDRMGEIKGAPAVIDLKCVAKLMAQTSLQTAAYAQIALEHWGVEVKHRYAVQLRPDGQYRCKRYSDRADRRVFLAYLQGHLWRLANGV